jgi:hypothetical protein
MRLNGWLRVGIVASVLWVLIGDFFIHGRIIDELGAPVIAELKSCAEADGSDWQACRAAYNRDYPGAMTGHRQYAGIITAIPWALFWVLAFIATSRSAGCDAASIRKPPAPDPLDSETPAGRDSHM